MTDDATTTATTKSDKMTTQAALDAEVTVLILIIVKHGAKLVLNAAVWTILGICVALLGKIIEKSVMIQNLTSRNRDSRPSAGLVQ